MTLIDIKTVTKYLLASILVGVVLGISGAFAAQGFRSGIVIITEYLQLFLRVIKKSKKLLTTQ